MRILLVSDAWLPQINGVVRTLGRVQQELGNLGHEVRIISPDQFLTVPCPGYWEIKLAIAPKRKLARLIDEFAPEAIHIPTEGPLGLAARRICLTHGWPFSTSFHTRFPEYIQARIGLPPDLIYAWLRWFHRPSGGVLVATKSLGRELEQRRFRNIRAWSRGVDTELFHPRAKNLYDLPRPIFLYVGRVAVEKNVDAFLDLDLPGSKVVVGDGPLLASLRRRYPGVRFTGAKIGEELAEHFASADVFVFPSRTDTFGLVLLEALASGLPVAAFPVPGPVDVIDGAEVGYLDEDLGSAARRALDVQPALCRDYALRFSWTACAEQFLENLQPCG